MATNTTAYYDDTAKEYDRIHGDDANPEHVAALDRAWPLLTNLAITSALDVGCGTGRSLGWLQKHLPGAHLVGLEPSPQMLDLARQRVPDAELVVGHGERMPFRDGQVDLVVASGIMHHADKPAAVIREMFRVARKAVLISDHNNFAFGSTKARWARLGLYACQLLGAATFVKQGFRRQGYTDDDGWWYPYSLLNDYGTIAREAREVVILPTRGINSNDCGNFMLAQSHMAILGLK